MERLTKRKFDGTGVSIEGAAWEAFEKLAAYEDAEEEGRWVALPPKTKDVDFMRICELITADGEGRAIILPCKVGSTVYWISDLSVVWENKVKEHGYILTDIVAGFRVYGEHELRLVLPNLGIEPIYPHKHLFLTREEAEAALKGAKTDG